MATIQWVGANGTSDASDAANYSPAQVPVAGDTLIFNTGSVSVNVNAGHLLEIAVSDLIVTSDWTGFAGGAAVSDGSAYTADSDATADSTKSDITISGSDVEDEFPVNSLVRNVTDKTWHRITVSASDANGTHVDVLPGAVTTFKGQSVQAFDGPFAVSPSKFALWQHTGTTGDYMILGTTSDAGADLRCPKLTVRGANRTAKLYLDGDITRCTILRGDVTIESTTKGVDNLMVGYVDSRLNDVDLTIEAGATVPVIEVTGGDCTNANAVATSFKMSGGEWQHTAGTVASVEMWGGAFEWDDPGGTVTALKVFGGTFDATGDSSAKTLTAATLYDGVIDLRNQAANITVTTGVLKFGGQLYVDAGTTVDVSYE